MFEKLRCMLLGKSMRDVNLQIKATGHGDERL